MTPTEDPERLLLLLLTDREELIAELQLAVGATPYDILPVRTSGAWDDAHSLRPNGIGVIDMKVATADSRALLRRCQSRYPEFPVYVISDDISSSTVIEAMRMGASDVLRRPIDPAYIRDTYLKLTQLPEEGLAVVPFNSIERGSDSDYLIAHSKVMIDLMKRIGVAARNDDPVLILGERGTGKSLLARTIHRFSSRVHQPFLTLDCSSLPEAVLMEELLGLESEGPDSLSLKRPGALDYSEGGTLYLEGFETASRRVQETLREFLVTGRFRRLGGSQDRSANVRIIATAVPALAAQVDDGRFDADLFELLQRQRLRAPSLNERREDIPPLVAHFATMHGWIAPQQVVGIERAALAHLGELAWRENVRQLETVVKQMLATVDSDVITLEAVRMLTSSWDRAPGAPPRRRGAVFSGTDGNSTGEHEGDVWARLAKNVREAAGLLHSSATGDDAIALHEVILGETEKQLIMTVYERTRQNQSETARMLGISRNNLRAKLKTYGEIE